MRAAALVRTMDGAPAQPRRRTTTAAAHRSDHLAAPRARRDLQAARRVTVRTTVLQTLPCFPRAARLHARALE
jgi:hypothetical protein